MLRISRLADYATLITNYLASNLSRVVSASELAREIPIGLPTVSKILKSLLDAGLVVSFRGNEGGYTLSRLPEAMSVAEVITAIDGELTLTACCAGEHTCSLESVCGTHGNWRIINKVVMNALSGLRVSDMARPLEQETLLPVEMPLKNGICSGEDKKNV